MKNYSLCLNMIVKNESHVIEDTLNNIINNFQIDYWVISDTGSTDTTKEKIMNFFDKNNIKGELHNDVWEDFGYNRTKALEYAYNKSDYILIFDADDKIYGEIILPLELKDMNSLRFGSEDFSYYKSILINNRKRWKYNGVLHEFLSPIDNIDNVENIIKGTYYIQSGKTGYRNLDKDKYIKDAEILEKAFDEEKNDFIKNRYAFYCGQSYKDAKIYNKAIEWYKKVLTLDNWNQEKYYSCCILGELYKINNNNEEAINYWSKGINYDNERIECHAFMMKYYYENNNHFMVNNIYNSIKNYNIDISKKLFVHTNAENEIYYYNSISAFYMNNKESGYYCCKKLIENHSNIDDTVKNIMFYEELLNNDKIENIVKLFYNLDEIIYKKECNIDYKYFDLWELLFEKVKIMLTGYSDKIIKLNHEINNDANDVNDANDLNDIDNYQETNDNVNVFLSFTTCKRYELFEQTINSLINTWIDYKKIDYWFCVDDNSEKKDKEKMLNKYSFIDYYFKMENEKGHKNSMNIIYNKILELKPKYWIHIEDDFLFYKPSNYIGSAIECFENFDNENIKQIMFNRCYAETIKDYNFTNYKKINEYFALQHYEKNSNNYGTGYWPYFSLRPSIIKVDSILNTGNFDSNNNFFEFDYANKWSENGYKTAFFNRITNKHIGKLTYENNKKNAYQMNNHVQFDNNNIKIINLKKRTDRRTHMKNLMEKQGIYNYDFFEAIDGYQLEASHEIKELFRNNDFSYRKGYIGCALSHIELWRQLVNDTSNDFYLILEDDIELNINFKKIYDSLKEYLKNLEMIFLGYHMYENLTDEIKEEYSSLNKGITIQDFRDNLSFGGFFSYSINKVCAKKLLEYIDKDGLQHGIDYYVQKILHVNKMFDCKELKPHIVKSNYYYYYDVDTDIQNNYEQYIFSEIEKTQNTEEPEKIQAKSDNISYIFIKGHDIPNNIEFKYNNGVHINEIHEKCNSNNKYVGFNTKGEIKNKMTLLVKNPEFKQDNEGIFIKKNIYNKFVERLQEERKIKEELKEIKINKEPLEPVRENSQEQDSESNIKLEINEVQSKKNKLYRVKMICNWCSSEQLCKEWKNMCLDNFKWNNIEITWDNNDIDYYVIINKPNKDYYEFYESEKTIIYQMEPWVCFKDKNWGVKTWNEWSIPDENKFLHVHSHRKYLNNVQWWVKIPNSLLLTRKKQDRFVNILSNKNFDDGHQKRINLCKNEQYIGISDTYGRDNYFHLKNYCGNVIDEKKENILLEYKYSLVVENNKEYNYATEKLWDSLICESLPFYWGCPNLEDYLDPLCFVRLDLNDIPGSIEIMKKAIKEDWWSKRIHIIRKEKDKIINDLGFFPRLSKIIQEKENNI